jgi:hypothetical protein
MKFLALPLVAIGLCISSLHADDYVVRTFIVTIKPTAQKPESVYTVAGAMSGNNWPLTLPILLGNGTKAYPLSINVHRDESTGEQTVNYQLQDPAAIIPGGGSTSGYMATIFDAWFPYSTSKIPIYSDSDNGTIFAQIVEGKPVPATSSGK